MAMYLIKVDANMEALLSAEDLDGDGRITTDDLGPKVQRHGHGSMRMDCSH